MADLTLAARALKFRLDVARVLSGSSSVFLSADVKALLREQSELIAEIAQRLQHGTPPADSGDTRERK